MSVDIEFAPVTEADIGEVAQFLRTSFGANEDWVPFQPEVLRWKALGPHPLWPGSRSYLLRTLEEIVAHGCSMPARFLTEGSEVSSACIIDWAASKAFPGTGMRIYREIGDFSQTVIGVGGSDDSQKVLPLFGLKPRGDFLTYAKVIRPLKAYLSTKYISARGLARFGRDVARGFKQAKRAAKDWSVKHVEKFDGTVAVALPRPGVIAATVCYRDAAILNYFLKCPAARMQGLLFYEGTQIRGYAILAFIGNECRIADLWISSDQGEDWTTAHLLVNGVAAADPHVTRVVSGSSVLIPQNAAKAAGAHLHGRQTLYVKAPKSLLPKDLDLAIAMLDFDAFYL